MIQHYKLLKFKLFTFDKCLEINPFASNYDQLTFKFFKI